MNDFSKKCVNNIRSINLFFVSTLNLIKLEPDFKKIKDSKFGESVIDSKI